MWSIVPRRKPLLVFRLFSLQGTSYTVLLWKKQEEKLYLGQVKRSGEGVEKSEVYKNIFPKTKMRRWGGVRGGRGLEAFSSPRLPPTPLFKRSVSWLTCTRTGPYLILKRGFDYFFTCACSLHRHCLCIPEMIKQSLPPYTWDWKTTDLCPIKLQIKSLVCQNCAPYYGFQKGGNGVETRRIVASLRGEKVFPPLFKSERASKQVFLNPGFWTASTLRAG